MSVYTKNAALQNFLRFLLRCALMQSGFTPLLAVTETRAGDGIFCGSDAALARLNDEFKANAGIKCGDEEFNGLADHGVRRY